MANTYGARISPDDGGKQIILDASMRYASYLGSAQMMANAGSVGGFKSQPVNSRAMIVPRNLVKVNNSGNPAGPQMAYIRSM